MKTGLIKTQYGSVSLSRMLFGASHLGSVQNREESFKLLDLYYEAGGRALETGRSSFDGHPYGASQSERTIRDWMRDRGVSERMRIICKGGHPDARDMHFSRLDRKNLEHDLMTSLAVLDVEKVTCFMLHRDDERIPVGEIMDVLDDFVKRGYADFVAASNWTVRRINEANAYAAAKGQVTFSASSILWNLGKFEQSMMRDDTQVFMSDSEYVGYLENNLPVFAFSSQAVGYFSKVIAGQELKRPRVRLMDTEENRLRAERVREICKKYAVGAGAVCLAYIACNKVNGFPIFGCSSKEQFEEAREAFELELAQEDIEFIEGRTSSNPT